MTDLTDERLLRWPEKLTLRDTRIFADEGQRIFTTATGRGYEKQEYIRADLAHRTNGGEAAKAAVYICAFDVDALVTDDMADAVRAAFDALPEPEFGEKVLPLYLASPVSIPQDGTSGVPAAAKAMVSAWEVLPEGNHSVSTTQRWIIDDLKPAIDGIRAALIAALAPSP